ncbi:hypothetical protein AT268_31210 [Bacillus cereus]|uniref:Uncharacterized protein n=1 Tax=Bacillus cereus TaxID=1396 RepID=A0A9X0MJI2_BACCE|nr:hypothetical protein [Bacillus cereus]KXY51013.1 hypothetical protein AT268_31210 [Bacillus cereus]
MTTDTYKGFLTTEIEGEDVQLPPVILRNDEEIIRFCYRNRQKMKEVIVQDKDEFCLFHIKNNKTIFPLEAVENEKQLAKQWGVEVAEINWEQLSRM